jgi:hypothetical protein
MQVAAEAKKIHTRMGAKVWLFQNFNAGTGTGVLGYNMSFVDQAALGKCLDALQTDAEWQAYVARDDTFGASGPAVLASQATANDLPGFENPEPVAPGTFVAAAAGQLKPGCSAPDALHMISDFAPLSKQLGASWVRARVVVWGGENTLTYITTQGFPSAEAWGQWQLKLATDPQAQLQLQRAFGPASPFSGLVQSTGWVLPL